MLCKCTVGHTFKSSLTFCQPAKVTKHSVIFVLYPLVFISCESRFQFFLLLCRWLHLFHFHVENNSRFSSWTLFQRNIDNYIWPTQHLWKFEFSLIDCFKLNFWVFEGPHLPISDPFYGGVWIFSGTTDTILKHLHFVTWKESNTFFAQNNINENMFCARWSTFSFIFSHSLLVVL